MCKRRAWVCSQVLVSTAEVLWPDPIRPQIGASEITQGEKVRQSCVGIELVGKSLIFLHTVAAKVAK